MPYQLLVADDSATMQKVVEITFAREDFSVVAVGTGAEALQSAKSNPPDVALIDVRMPGMDGYQVCEALKADASTSSIPVCLLGGTVEPFDEARAKASGADAHVIKPFETHVLIDRVKSLVGEATAPSAGVAASTAAAAPPSAPPAPAPEAPSTASAAAPPSSIPPPPPAASPLSPPPAPAGGSSAETGPGLFSSGVPTPPAAPSAPSAPPSPTPGPELSSAVITPPPPETPSAPNPPPSAKASEGLGAIPGGIPSPPAGPGATAATPVAGVPAPPPKDGPRPARARIPTPLPSSPTPKLMADSDPVGGLGRSSSEPPDTIIPSPAHEPDRSVSRSATLPSIPSPAGAPTEQKREASPQNSEAVEAMTREVIEQIVWQVVPELAETIIRERLDQLVKD